MANCQQEACRVLEDNCLESWSWKIELVKKYSVWGL